MLRVAQWSEEVVPTVAFNFRKVRRGNITLKIWDVAGACYCPLGLRSRRWLIESRLKASRGTAQYVSDTATASTQLCACTVLQLIACVLTVVSSFVVDSSDVRVPVHLFMTSAHHHPPQKEKFDTARFELHQLLSQPSLSGVPLLVVSSASAIRGPAFSPTRTSSQLGNKNDIDGHAPVNELIKALYALLTCCVLRTG